MKKPVTKPASAKPAVKATVKPAAVKVPAKKTTAPAKKKSAAAEPPVTFITAQIDIGFGNSLTIRGEGPGLSWDQGQPMDNADASLWSATIKNATKPIVFKVLVNDLTWSAGPDYVVEPGQSITIQPTF